MRILRNRKRMAIVVSVVLVSIVGVVGALSDVDVVQRRLSLTYEGIRDTDDMCIWIHPTDTSLSTIIAADKSADTIVVFDLKGDVLQTIKLVQDRENGSEQPGNIDLRYGYPLGDEVVDIVAFNQRAFKPGRGIHVYKVDPETRLLSRIDDGTELEHKNYGVCLYHSQVTGKFYAFATAKKDGVAQYELVDNGEGRISPVLVRSWEQKKCEGAVADDELGYVYICEESSGIWRYAAEPDASTEGTHIAAVGENGFKKDAEGVTIYYAADGRGYIIVSSQGSNSFLVYDRQPPHGYIKTFSVEGARDTDGIDVTNVDLGPDFPYGIFVCHADGSPSIALVVAYEDLGLKIDTFYDPRGRGDED